MSRDNSHIEEFPEERFQAKQLLAKGGQGIVYRCPHELFCGDVAVKLIQKITESEKREIENMIRARHENIVQFFGVVVSSSRTTIGYVMKFMEDGSLDDEIHSSRSYRVSLAYSWMQQAAAALAYLHEKKIVHRDVKPLNMLLADNKKTLKICDLGLARPALDMTSGGGTYLYMAPEVLMSFRKASFASDVWGIGVSMWEVLRRSAPYVEESFGYDAIKRIMDGSLTLPWPGQSDRETGDMLARIWNHEPSKRPSMLEVMNFAKQKKETSNDSYVRAKGKTKSGQMEAAMDGMSLDGSSSSSSASSSLEGKDSKSCLSEWLTTSVKLGGMPKLHSELASISGKSREFVAEMDKIRYKKTEKGVNDWKAKVKGMLAELLAAAMKALKAYPKDPTVTEYVNGTQLVEQEIERKALSKLESFKTKVQTNSSQTRGKPKKESV